MIGSSRLHGKANRIAENARNLEYSDPIMTKHLWDKVWIVRANAIRGNLPVSEHLASRKYYRRTCNETGLLSDLMAERVIELLRMPNADPFSVLSDRPPSWIGYMSSLPRIEFAPLANGQWAISVYRQDSKHPHRSSNRPQRAIVVSHDRAIRYMGMVQSSYSLRLYQSDRVDCHGIRYPIVFVVSICDLS